MEVKINREIKTTRNTLIKEELMVLFDLLTFGRQQYIIEHMLNFKMGG